MQDANLIKKASPLTAPYSAEGAALAEVNVNLLRQLSAALGAMDDALYTRQIDDTTSPIGAHARHIIEFYQALVKSITTNDLDGLSYDKRERNLEIETSRTAGIDAIAAVINVIEKPLDNQAMQVTSIINPDLDPVQMPTLLYRELFYVFDHAIHHMALIKMIARASDHALPTNFGVAQSTQAYLKTQNVAS